MNSFADKDGEPDVPFVESGRPIRSLHGCAVNIFYLRLLRCSLYKMKNVHKDQSEEQKEETILEI
jgi:hypothetical protein